MLQIQAFLSIDPGKYYEMELDGIFREVIDIFPFQEEHKKTKTSGWSPAAAERERSEASRMR